MILIKKKRVSTPLDITKAVSGIETHDHTMTLCQYLLMTIEEVSAAWSPTWVHMIVDKRRSSGAVKWSPAHAEAIETGNGGRCGVMASKLSNLRILYFPQSFTHPPVPAVTRALTHTHVHTHDCTHGSNPLRLPVLHPPGVKVWYQPICSNHPHNPNSYSCTTPDPLSSFSYLVCATVEGQPRQNTLHRALDQHSQKGSGRRVKWAKKRKTADMKSCLDSSMIHTDILTSLDASNNHSFNHCTFTAMIGNIYVFIFA